MVFLLFGHFHLIRWFRFIFNHKRTQHLVSVSRYLCHILLADICSQLFHWDGNLEEILQKRISIKQKILCEGKECFNL